MGPQFGHLLCVWVGAAEEVISTHNAVLDAKAQLVSEVRPADENHGDRRTPDNVHLDPGLRLETLKEYRVRLATGDGHQTGTNTET